MEAVLYDRFGRHDLGENRNDELPVIGAVHNATGYLVSEMLGCGIRYNEGATPDVLGAERDSLDIDYDAAFESEAFTTAVMTRTVMTGVMRRSRGSSSIPTRSGSSATRRPTPC